MARAALAPPQQTGPTTPLLRSGWTAFDEAGLVQPGRTLLVDAGAEAASRLLCRLLAEAVAARGEAIVMDGGNWLDVYRLGDCAEEAGHPRLATLRGVRVARGFTAYQLQSLVEDAMPRAVEEAQGRVGLVLVSWFPEMYLDEDLSPTEAAALATRALATCRDVARRHDVPVLVSNATLPPGARHRVRRAMDEGVDEAAALLPAKDGLRLLARGRSVLMPPPRARQRLLGEFDATEGPAGAFARHAADARIRYLPKRAGELRHRQKQEAVA